MIEIRSPETTRLPSPPSPGSPCYVWLDFDDTVITLFGKQQQGKVGYNPRYHRRPSLKAKVCFVGESNELLKLHLYNGKTHILTDFPAFYKYLGMSCLSCYTRYQMRLCPVFTRYDGKTSGVNTIES